ncbi:hypothetical protein ASF28_18620 [Methylobacterium sp. Leaf99]|uniref:hypothetical protein n=1 Tax=Methylobacterium sp. Leaf99 TaxID=1736251 RepID=UPI0006F84BD8|nr:hypothetical protein [Methylobacterium sp. Leaf99]KQP05903.1 hypothetical protein ASF28_18620 [Methylobacterium sp. Leaf99]
MDGDLFDAAGLPLPPIPPKKRQRSPRKPTPAERAATGRLKGARRSRAPQRQRVGPERDLSPAVAADVVPFPLHRNGGLLAEVVDRLPHGYSGDLGKVCAKETREFQHTLMRQGVDRQPAWLCARTLLHHAFMKRVHDAHREAGTL